jgi:hypothetical protein
MENKHDYPSLTELTGLRKELVEKKETGLKKFVDAAIHVVSKSDMLMLAPSNTVQPDTSLDTLDAAQKWTDEAIDIVDRLLGLLQDHTNEISARRIGWFPREEAVDVS